MAPGVKAAILGSGNIGTDLMYKLKRRSRFLKLVAVIGIDPESEGLARARREGLVTSSEGISFFEAHPELADIVFDATSARSHARHAPILEKLGKTVIDLTPAAVGPFVVPPVNLGGHLDRRNVNLITCGGQATIPIVAAVSRVARVKYAEIVATIASHSAGPGTRQNIDEFTHTTAEGLVAIGGAERGKAIIILNPAEPPIIMRDTVYTLVESLPDDEAVRESVREMVRVVQSYVPGYRLTLEPLREENKITTMIEVEGAGDFLPRYAGNLDIMTAAAVAVGEAFAARLLGEEVEPGGREIHPRH